MLKYLLTLTEELLQRRAFREGPEKRAASTEAVIASPALFAGRGNPGFTQDGLRQAKRAPRDAGLASSAGRAEKRRFSARQARKQQDLFHVKHN